MKGKKLYLNKHDVVLLKEMFLKDMIMTPGDARQKQKLDLIEKIIGTPKPERINTIPTNLNCRFLLN